MGRSWLKPSSSSGCTHFSKGGNQGGWAVTGSQGAGQWMAQGNYGYRRFELYLYPQVVLTWRPLSFSLQIIVGAGMSDLCSHGGLQLCIPLVACCNLWATAWACSAYAGDPWPSWRERWVSLGKFQGNLFLVVCTAKKLGYYVTRVWLRSEGHRVHGHNLDGH